MKVKMLKNQNGSDWDGKRTKPAMDYLAGKEYDVSPRFAKILVEDLRVAILIKPVESPEKKASHGAPENKGRSFRKK